MAAFEPSRYQVVLAAMGEYAQQPRSFVKTSNGRERLARISEPNQIEAGASQANAASRHQPSRSLTTRTNQIEFKVVGDQSVSLVEFVERGLIRGEMRIDQRP
jgi:hypothetical protein